MKDKMQILYVCWGNTCRSPFAQYITEKYYADKIQCNSAGVQVKDSSKSASEHTMKVMKKSFDKEISSHIPKGIQTLENQLSEYDLIIAMDKEVFDLIKTAYPTSSNVIHWDIADPMKPDATEEEYTHTAIEIFQKIKAQFENH